MRNRQKYKNINRRKNLLGVPAFVKASQMHGNTFISFAQLNDLCYGALLNPSLILIVLSKKYHATFKHSRLKTLNATFFSEIFQNLLFRVSESNKVTNESKKVMAMRLGRTTGLELKCV